MGDSKTNKSSQPCIWMSAGLLSYKLCDRDWDCDHCPLDAALRGQMLEAPPRGSLLSIGEVTKSFPEDRLYSPGHLWVQSRSTSEEQLVRIGLDIFAATIVGHCCDVTCPEIGQERAQGDSLCEIDLGLGILCLAAPFQATMVTKNVRLDDDPNKLVQSPYEDGWVAELQVQDRSRLHGLSTARQARDQTKMDLRRFRRRVAAQLLTNTEGLGPCLPDGGELADLRQILAGSAYLHLVRELIH